MFKNKQSGMSLIEVLVTLVLISVGLLGVAALQLTSLKGNQESYARTQAAMLAGDILDRIRANQIGFRSGQYDAAFNGTGTAGTIANTDLTRWQGTINQLLPGTDAAAAGSIARNDNIVTVTIQWDEREERGAATAGDATFVTGDPTVLPTFVTRSEI